MSTCSEEQVIADRIASDIKDLSPVPPALRVFDAGMGDATVLTSLMRNLHHQHPTVPFLIVGKEISQEDIRISLEKMADRFYEHPLTVLVLTNMLYSEAPWLKPRATSARARVNWLVAPLEGSTAFEFDEQIREIEQRVQHWWETTPSRRTGNPLYVTPSVLLLYRKDQEWPLAPVVPRGGSQDHQYDLVVAAQPFRARLSPRAKVGNVLAPLARCLAPGGRMVVIRSTGKDPGMEIVHGVSASSLSSRPGRTSWPNSTCSWVRVIQSCGSPTLPIPGPNSAMNCDCRRPNSKAASAPPPCWQHGMPRLTWRR